MKLVQKFAFAVLTIAIFGQCLTANGQTSVAIVDVGEIFKAIPTFNQELDQLKVEAEQFKANATQLQQQMLLRSEQLQKSFKPGTESFKSAETELAQELAAMEVDQRDSMRKLMQREAQLHFQTYQQVKQVIDDYCAARSIRLILRHAKTSIDEGNPNSVMQEVNKNIVYHASGLDITNAIIRQMSNTASLPGNAQR